MSYEPNNKLLGTRSNKICKVQPILEFIIDKVDNCQEIKRLTRYITKTPLKDKGSKYNGEIINQPNLIMTLLNDNNEGNKSLFDTMFNPEMEFKGNLFFIFISPYDVVINNMNCTMYFDISIIGDISYDDLLPHGKRIWKIAEYICDLFDGYTLDNKEGVTEDVGNLTFNINGRISNRRLSKTNNIMHLAIPLEVRYTGMRV